MTTTTADYIGAYTRDVAFDPKRAILVLVDMQYATGSRRGALARKHLDVPGGHADLEYRFGRIESLVVPNQQRLAAAFRAAGGKVMYIKIGPLLPDASDAPAHMRKMFTDLGNYAGSPDNAILEELRPEAGDIVINKTTIGAFASSGIDSILRAMGRDQLAVCGISTNMCVETTAREAADRGYAVTLVEDACATTHADLHASTMKNFARLFGRVRSCDEVLAEIAGPA
ncbi:cysteine hydrolase family protein [Teichococcus oryzae]|uniref:Cysteine hydrolase n=1 Tax=Teichococcus oryzae TaxID=1608942 RepID=A0A5B2TGF6_9PROT|nr:isochorismatase family cysteine hydrolase [Pseudoroseomonas oryzae]KAA2212998.1 cysteine hydrolase [Pseudoroseomonas oryzae]